MLNLEEFDHNFIQIKSSPCGAKISAYLRKSYEMNKDIDHDMINRWLLLAGFPSSYLFAHLVVLKFLAELFPSAFSYLFSEGFFSPEMLELNGNDY